MVDFDPANAARVQYGKVDAPWWSDRPVAVVGCGPSLRGFDLERLRGIAYVLCVKAAIFDYPWADAGTGIDAPRYIEWGDRFGEVKMPVFWGASGVHNLKPWPHVTFLRRLEGDGLTEDLGALNGGGTSGYAAVNLALHKHAQQIVLFGYDYNGHEGHHNDGHYVRKRNQSAGNWKSWARRFEQMMPALKARGIEVINASPKSQIECFPRVTPEQGLEWILARKRQEAA